MITKHSADDASAKPLQIGLRLARVVSIGNGTVDVCPIGSSVVLHDIPVTSATTMSVGDVINLQVMDNKRFAFASQNTTVLTGSAVNNVTIQNGDVIIAGEGGAGTVLGVEAGEGLTSSTLNGVVTLAVGSSVVRTSRSVFTGSGLTGGGNLSADRTLSVALAATSGLNTTGGLLAVGQGNGISVGTSSVAVNQAYAFTWTSAHAFDSGFTAAASTFTGLLTGTSSTFSGNVSVGTTSGGLNIGTTGAAAKSIRVAGSINVGTATGSTDGYIYTSGRIGVGKNAADYPLDVAGDIFSSASVRASTSVITQELTGAGATPTVSLTNGTGFKSSQYQSGFAGNGWRIYRQDNTAKSEWEVDNLTVRGTLSVYELLIQQIRATNGSIFVSAAAKIESVTGTGPYTLIVEGGSSDYAPFAVGDILRAQRVSLGTSTLVWQSDLTVTAISVGENTRAFTATLRAGSTAPAAGMEYVRLGNTTDLNRQGAVYLTADDSGAPFIDIVNDVTSHANWGTAAKVKVRIGRLNGIVGGATANYGIWSGTGTASTDSWVKMAEDGILLNNVPLKMYSGALQTVDFSANGNLKIGTNVANASTTALSWNGTTLAINGAITAQSGSIAGVLSIGTSGGIYQGTGTFATPTTGLKIWNDSGVGRIAGYNSGVLQWYANSDGTLKAGGGDVTLNGDGISLVSWVLSRGQLSLINGYRFSAGSTTFCGLYAFTESDGQTNLLLRNHGATDPEITIEAQDTSTTGVNRSVVTITANSPLYSTTARLDANAICLYGKGLRVVLSGSDSTVAAGGTLYTSGDTTVGGGLNVGNTTGAAAGAIKASGDVSANDAAFTGGLNVGTATGALTGQIKGATATFTGDVSANDAVFSGNVNAVSLYLSGNIDATGWIIGGTVGATLGDFDTLQVNTELKSVWSATWINTGITFSASWSNFAADETTWSFARYKRVGDLVFLRGMIKRASGTGLSISPFTLPANFRPAKRLICAVMALRTGQTEEAIRADVLSTGVVQFSNIGTTSAYDYISLNGIVFSVV